MMLSVLIEHSSQIGIFRFGKNFDSAMNENIMHKKICYAVKEDAQSREK